MSVASDTFAADTALDLRRDVAGLRQALRAANDERDRLERRVERLEKVIRTIAAAGVAHRLAVENMIREVL